MSSVDDDFPEGAPAEDPRAAARRRMHEEGEQRIRDLIAAAPAYVPPKPDDGVLPVDPAALDLELARFNCNDLGNALRFRHRHGGDFRFVRDVGWHAWTGTHWSRDEGEMRARQAAHETVRAMRQEVAALYAVGDGTRKVEGLEPEAAKKIAGRLAQFAISSGSSGSISAMLNEAAPYLQITVDDLDTDPFLFAVENGTIEIGPERIRLRGHRRTDFITKIAPVRYRKGAPRPKFEAYLAECQPSPEAREALQRVHGYAMTGKTGEQKIFFNLGGGRNGKSTLAAVARMVMGPYAELIPFASLAAQENKDGAGASPDIARLPGARLVTASEPEPGTRFSEGMIKTMTGESEILARHLRRDFFRFRPAFKVVLGGNHKPVVRGIDEGIWRRLVLIPWTVTIAHPVQDFHDVLFREEAAGILDWLLEGARLWCESGLLMPDAWRNATEAYRAESDALGEFLSTRVYASPGDRVQGSVLYAAYVEWAKASGYDPMKGAAFGKQLGIRGFRKSKSGSVFYQDIQLAKGEDVPRDDGRPIDEL